MTTEKTPSKHTALLSTQAELPTQTRGITAPIYHSAAYHYDDPQALSQLYQNQKKGPTYARTGNPTTADVERKLALLEEGQGAVAFTTGMAAYAALFFVLLEAGAHVLASQHLFANSVSLLKSYQKFGIDVDFVDSTCAKQIATKVKNNTAILLLETIANPCTQIPDWEGIHAICKEYPQLILVVDNTLTTPFGFMPKNIGAHIVIHSLTKSIMGHSRGLGGAIIDTGLMNWANHPLIASAYKHFGADAFLTQLRKKGLRDLGATLTAQHADLVLIGLETLQMRIEKSSGNAQKIAAYLNAHPYIESVLHPSLTQHPQHSIAKKHYLHHGFLISFNLKPTSHKTSRQQLNAFLKQLHTIKHCSSLGDNRSLIIDVAQTIFAELNESERRAMGIAEQSFRLSIGLEDPDDLIKELSVAINAAYDFEI